MTRPLVVTCVSTRAIFSFPIFVFRMLIWQPWLALGVFMYQAGLGSITRDSITITIAIT